MSDSNKNKYPALETVIGFYYFLGVLAIIGGIVGILVAVSMKGEIKVLIIIPSIIFGVFGTIFNFAQAEMIKLFINIANDTAAIRVNTTTTTTKMNKGALVPETISIEKIKEVLGQKWMTKNLDVDKFRNGDIIPEAKTNQEWKEAGKNKQSAWCYYQNDPSNGEKYGRLYNWYAVIDPRGLAPEGWHIPSDAEWKQLIDFLGDLAGTKMKSTDGWEDNGNGTNESGFNGLPAGERYSNGKFCGIGNYCLWWCSPNYYNSLPYCLPIFCKDQDVIRRWYYEEHGFSVRCFRD